MNSTFYSTHMARRIEQFMYKVYGWMFAGLAITAATSFSLFNFFPQIMVAILTNQMLFWGLFLAQIGLVMVLSAALQRLNFVTAALMFILYASLVGITLSPIFLVYTWGSIYTTFLITSGMFGAMALYGYYTENDLTSLGNILLMGLIGLLLAGFINRWVGSSQTDFLLSIGGVIIFTLLTAYDVQKIKTMSTYAAMHEESESKIAIRCALTLYLDFINLFLYVLRFMGNKKRN
ncbi:MAG: Bax inhibitor-1/YccA family protein [Candidatus Babeliales bacterium]